MDPKKQNSMAVTALRAGRIQEAESLLNALIQKYPDHLDAKYNLGRLYLNTGRARLAEPLIMDCAAASPTLDVAWTLVDVLQANDKLTEAISVIEDILIAAPQDATANFRLAQLLKQSDKKKAKSLYEKAWKLKPSLAHGIEYAKSVADELPTAAEEVLQTLLHALPPDHPDRLVAFEALLPFVEFGRRSQHGKAPHHAAGLDELFFTYAKNEFGEYAHLALKLAAAHPDKPKFILNKAIVQFCMRHYADCETSLKRFNFKGHIWENVIFTPDVLDSLATDDPSAWDKVLAPARDETPPKRLTSKNVVFLACDAKYFFSFALPMIRSLRSISKETHVHLHLFDLTRDQMDAALECLKNAGSAFTVSSEQSGAKNLQDARNYYHSIRFIRLYEMIRANHKHNFWMMDVDALVNRNLVALFKRLEESEVALRIRAGRLEPWNQFNASVVGFSNTQNSLNYLKFVCAYIMRFHSQGKVLWGIDQLAMFIVYEHLRSKGRAPSLAFLNETDVDLYCTAEGIIWCNSGAQKFFMIENNKLDTTALEDHQLRFKSKFLENFDERDLSRFQTK